MQILLVTETYLPYITGVSISTDSIARYMVSKGHKVTLLYPRPLVPGSVEKMKSLTLVEVPSFKTPFYNFNATAIYPLAVPVIEKLMHSTKFDVVHIQEPGALGQAVLKKAKSHNIPIVGALHFIPEQIDRVLGGYFEKILTPLFAVYIKSTYNKYDQIMTPSIFFANYLKSIGVAKPINVISNGTDIKRFFPLKNKVAKKTVDLFFLGRLDKDKNVETLVKALKYTDNNVKLTIVGRGTEKDNLQKLAKSINVESKIKWVDYITDAEMPSYYQKADIFTIMSPYEGQSIVTLQAIATGLPIIVANAGALPELCKDKVNGFLVDTYNYKTLAEKINILARDKNMRTKFGSESRKISLDHDKKNVLHKLEIIFDKLRTNKFPFHQENTL